MDIRTRAEVGQGRDFDFFLLALDHRLGTGSEMLKPLAVAVIGASARAFTLILVPVLYAGVFGASRQSSSDQTSKI